MRRQAALFAIAVALVAVVFAVAIAQKVTGVTPPPVDFATIMLGAIAVAFSLPLIGAPILFARRKFRQAWRTGDPSSRLAVLASMAIRLVGAVVVWTVFILVVSQRGRR